MQPTIFCKRESKTNSQLIHKMRKKSEKIHQTGKKLEKQKMTTRVNVNKKQQQRWRTYKHTATCVQSLWMRKEREKDRKAPHCICGEHVMCAMPSHSMYRKIVETGRIGKRNVLWQREKKQQQQQRKTKTTTTQQNQHIAHKQDST